MLIYLVLMFLIYLSFIAFSKPKALKISFVMIALVASLRKYTVGVDTTQFYNMFSRIGLSNSWDYRSFRFEPGFFYLCKVLYRISNDPQILIIVTSCFISHFVYRFIKNNSVDYQLSTFLFIIMNIFFSYMNIMRQALAAALLLFAYEYLKEKRYIVYVALVGIASLFHIVSVAALLWLLFAILPNKKWTYAFETAIAIGTFALYRKFFNLLTLGFGYEGYLDSKFGVSNYFGALLAALEAFVIIGTLLFFAYKGIKIKEMDMSVDRILIIVTIIYIWFCFLVIRMNIFNRISGLFSIYNIILVPLLLKRIRIRNVNNYKILKSGTVVIYFMSFLIIGLLRPGWYGAIPYEFFWL